MQTPMVNLPQCLSHLEFILNIQIKDLMSLYSQSYLTLEQQKKFNGP